MAIAKYKAVKPFSHEGVDYGIGMVMIENPKDVVPLVETGKLRFECYLDPEDQNDAAQIKRFENNPTGAKRLSFSADIVEPGPASAALGSAEESEKGSEESEEKEVEEKPKRAAKAKE